MSSFMVFPGQGAQYPQMLHQLPDEALIRECLLEARDELGEEIGGLDSAQALTYTRAVQLCLLISGVACARLLIERSEAPTYVAGLSIGAYPAAVIAGSLGFGDALRLVALRGELMQNAYPTGYGMTAILGLDQTTVEALIAEVHCAETPLYLANINAEAQMVVAGSDAAMAHVAELAKAKGAAAAKRLLVSVPSHCALLDQPALALADAFAKVSMQAPTVRYLSGSTARLVMTVDKLRDDLTYNMCRVIDWRSTVQTAYERGVRLQIELPPGTVLTGLGRKVFEPGAAVAFQGARLDTLGALLQEEGRRNP
ncbi:malonate decarboxylase subunit epsilon [Pseudomonas sp. MH10]|uniref:malonate decarboxylase subunit epsilon n=1 Tax=Pseudomonas sp. MH10 TaxID=3048627 RepID=UPI002AC8B683|nr:malonate decarboxylase subunit epsilon [Pseudomonas sp. MH10]MEB0039394.1 malonate decarboxylase subunit epsilon [Pseudomonas sp. MH10]WPX62337.1 malonate decarboxylase subunit epsilon [Pseudomonas sp. MH10]